MANRRMDFAVGANDSNSQILRLLVSQGNENNRLMMEGFSILSTSIDNLTAALIDRLPML